MANQPQSDEALVRQVLEHCDCDDPSHHHAGPRAVGAAAGDGDRLRKLVGFIVKLLQAFLDRQPRPTPTPEPTPEPAPEFIPPPSA